MKAKAKKPKTKIKMKTKKTFVKSFVSQDRLNIHIVVSTILDNKPISSNIKLNIDDNHLSFGNLCRLIKSLSKNKSSAMQGEIFSILFNTDIVNDTTVNNYCVGVRGINDTYKQVYLNYRKKYEKDENILKPTITRIISIMDGIIQLDNIDINKSTSLKLLCNKLYNISKNDKSCSEEFTNNLRDSLEDNNLIKAFSEISFFCILDKN